MNKQEIINKSENLESRTESMDYDNGYEKGVYDSLSHVILLDEQKKVKVPQFIADIIEGAGGRREENKEYVIRSVIDDYYHEKLEQFVLEWFDKCGNILKFYQAVDNNYDIEEEQLYYVKLPEIGYMRFDKKYLYSTDKEDAKQYTENQIKSIDERYWLFAVKEDDE